MPNGTVKFFNVGKGFGFITSDEDGKDVFVPAATVKSAGVMTLITGQRVTYETKPDVKGLKAVELQVVAAAPAPKTETKVRTVPLRAATNAKLKVYLDPDSDVADEVLDEVTRSCRDFYVVDYVTSALTIEELQRLSLLLRDSDQSLVRRYDPLFLELRLDDRFIGDAEFWGAIVEHPALINGPILACSAKASVCRSASAVKAFLDSLTAANPKAAPKTKSLPESLRRLLTGQAQVAVAAPEKIIADFEWRPAAEVQVKSEPTSEKPLTPGTSLKEKTKLAATPKTAVSKIKVPTKPVRAAKKATQKPVNKTKRVGRK